MAGQIMKRVHLLISGLVQGVFFRHGTKEKAQSLNLTGWVRNTQEGGVEVVAQGAKENLEELIKWCRQGPPSARVEKVEVEWGEATREFQEFEIKY